MTAMDKDLIDGHKFYVKQKWTANNHDDIKKKKQDANRKEHIRKNKSTKRKGFMK